MAPMAKQARGVGASANPAFRLSLTEIQVFRNEIQAGVEQIPNPAERNPN
jgi:hypothetical protein